MGVSSSFTSQPVCLWWLLTSTIGGYVVTRACLDVLCKEKISSFFGINQDTFDFSTEMLITFNQIARR
jgi:hypothetical protein